MWVYASFAMCRTLRFADYKSYGGSPPSYNGRLRPCRALGGLSVVLALVLCGWSDLRLCLSGLASMGRAQNFRAHGRKFSYVRKYFFLRTEILPLANPLGMRVVRRGKFVPLRRVFDEGSGRLSWAGKSAYLHEAFSWIAS